MRAVPLTSSGRASRLLGNRVSARCRRLGSLSPLLLLLSVLPVRCGSSGTPEYRNRQCQSCCGCTSRRGYSHLDIWVVCVCTRILAGGERECKVHVLRAPPPIRTSGRDVLLTGESTTQTHALSTAGPTQPRTDAAHLPPPSRAPARALGNFHVCCSSGSGPGDKRHLSPKKARYKPVRSLSEKLAPAKSPGSDASHTHYHITQTKTKTGTPSQPTRTSRQKSQANTHAGPAKSDPSVHQTLSEISEQPTFISSPVGMRTQGSVDVCPPFQRSRDVCPPLERP